MRALRTALGAVALLSTTGLGPGCGREPPQPSPEMSPQNPSPRQDLDDAERDDVEGDSLVFVDRVWQVKSSSSVEPGTLYVFLSEGTLVIASGHGTPLLGAWKYENDALTMIENGLPSEVDILHSSADKFRIRLHNPGEPVEILFAPATTD